RRLDGSAKRQLGRAILDAVARAQSLAEDELPARPARPPAPAREPLVNFLNAAIAEIARDVELPPSLLVPRAALERLSREVPDERAEFERVLGLQPWRLGLVAEPLWDLCRGEASLKIEGYAGGDPKVRVVHESVAQ
ncbi:MAG: hypothetical protein JO263_02075, partial [Candidatus Eremiobacteraeota bacterium]|nr:hypothetical protein [Candidatus Eremiobacteraeota bacterium]